MQNNDLGQKLKEAMDNSGFSRKVIADRAGLKESNLYKLMKGNDIKLKTLLKLVKVLDIQIQDFIETQDDKLVEELRQTIANLELKNRVLDEQIRSIDQQVGVFIEILKNIEEDSKSPSPMYTLITLEGEKKITLSDLLQIFHRMVMFSNILPHKMDLYYKHTSLFFNIIEVRRAAEQCLHLYPMEVQEIFSSMDPELAENQYIDFEKIWKNTTK